MFNFDVRAAIKNAGFFNYSIAAALGVPETSFSRKLSRGELSSEEKERILHAIENLLKEREMCGNPARLKEELNGKCN